MCGLAGLFEPAGGDAAVRQELVARMGDSIAHRGPDGAGVWSDAKAGLCLAHRRLAVVDLSDRGSQPMTSADGRYVLVFNGEIYDHDRLRRVLQDHGTRFRGTSDTEVLLEAIARWGLAEALRRTNGMFALGVWDRQARTLSLARDRLGEKPLYTAWFGRTFAFASELQSLQLHPGCPRDVDRVALAQYLRHGWVAAPRTIVSGVDKLPAGSILSVRADGQRTAPASWWSVLDVAESGISNRLDRPDDELVDEGEELLLDAVRMRRDADVPVGAFLSGGVDSSTVVALLAASGPRPRTFTVAVGGDLDEARHAAAVARHLGTSHTEIRLEPGEALGAVTDGLGTFDEPFADPSAVPTMLMCREARRHVTVCLGGDGGDELFAGYNRHRVAGRLGSALRLPAPWRRAVTAGLVRVPPRRWDRWTGLAAAAAGREVPPASGDKVHKLAALLGAAGPIQAYQMLTAVWDPVLLLGADWPQQETAIDEATRVPGGGSPLERMLLADQRVVLPDDMLVKVDRASMSVGLEARVPLLDHRVVEWSWRLPERAKVRGGRGKWLLRQVLARHVPPALTERPKLGFDPPVGSWLRGPLHDWARDLLSPRWLADMGLDAGVVDASLADHQSGRRNLDYQLWSLVALAAWTERVGSRRMVVP